MRQSQLEGLIFNHHRPEFPLAIENTSNSLEGHAYTRGLEPTSVAMPPAIRKIPAGYHTATPSLVVAGATKLLDFLKSAFGAKELAMFMMPDGTIGHSEVEIGDSRIMLGEATADTPAMPGRVFLYLDDVDVAYKHAIDAGATPMREPADQFYGDRTAVVKDPVGNVWSLATHIEDVSDEEVRKRMAAQAM